jgi:hypothetical protein
LGITGRFLYAAGGRLDSEKSISPRGRDSAAKRVAVLEARDTRRETARFPAPQIFSQAEWNFLGGLTAEHPPQRADRLAANYPTQHRPNSMISLPSRLRFSSELFSRVAVLCVATVLLLGPTPLLCAAAAASSHAVHVTNVTGSATNTVTSLVFLNDTTILIESQQVGHLTQFGDFTGRFSYVALASPTSILLLGRATLTNAQGEELFVTASILELGADYPRSANGTLTVTGGTGHYAGATGSIAISGTDEESLTDTFQLNGTLITVH